MALDQLSLLYLTSKHVQRHSELVVTLRKVGHAPWLGGAPSAANLRLFSVQLRSYRASRSVMEKASMLYNRFKHAYLLGEGEEVVSTTFLRSLLEEKEKEEEQRAESLQAVEERSQGGREEAHPEGDQSGGGCGPPSPPPSPDLRCAGAELSSRLCLQPTVADRLVLEDSWGLGDGWSWTRLGPPMSCGSLFAERLSQPSAPPGGGVVQVLILLMMGDVVCVFSLRLSNPSTCVTKMSF